MSSYESDLAYIHDAGFKVRRPRNYGGIPFPKGLVGYAARKPA